MPPAPKKTNYALIVIALYALFSAWRAFELLISYEYSPLDAALYALLAGLWRFVLFSVLFWIARYLWRSIFSLRLKYPYEKRQ